MFEGIEGVVTSSKPHCRRTAFATPFGGAARIKPTAFAPLLTSFYYPMVLYDALTPDRCMVE
jgi:hypothetical protein